jgi:hypothetical protein
MKKENKIKCEECGHEFSEEEAEKYQNKVRVHRGKIMCEDCLVDMGVNLDEADPLWTYIKTHTDIRMIR